MRKLTRFQKRVLVQNLFTKQRHILYSRKYNLTIDENTSQQKLEEGWELIQKDNENYTLQEIDKGMEENKLYSFLKVYGIRFDPETIDQDGLLDGYDPDYDPEIVKENAFKIEGEYSLEAK